MRIVHKIPCAMVLVYDERLTHSYWCDFRSRHRSAASLIAFLRKEVRKGKYVGFRLFWEIINEEIGCRS
jgi:hypothetical protein